MKWNNRLFVLIIGLLIASCSEDGAIQNSGWIEITHPTNEDIYELDYYQATLVLEGSAFFVEDPWSWVCCPYQDVLVNKPFIYSYNANLKAIGRAIEQGENWQIIAPLQYGENNLEIFANDSGGSNWAYQGNWGGSKIKVYVPKPDARLSELKLSTLILDQTFQPNLFSYTATVNYETTSTSITPTVPYPNISIRINGREVDSGQVSEQVILQEGSNTITVQTQVDRGVGSSEFLATYTLEINRKSAIVIPLSDDASFSGINLDDIVINEDFDPNVTSYTANVPFTVTSLKVMPIATQSSATIKINGVSVDSGSFSELIALGEGPNVITFEVTAEDGVTNNIYSLTINRESTADFIESVYIKASNTEAYDDFKSVALDGDTLVVGAPSEDSSATGLNGNEADNSAPNSGAVYVFVRDINGIWKQQAYLKASNADNLDGYGQSNAGFGTSVAISGDTLLVGAPYENSIVNDSGAAYVFTRDSQGIWSEQAFIKPPRPFCCPQFGREVELDGDTLVIGAPDDSNGASGVFATPLDECGYIHGNYVTYSGVVYVFRRTNEIWSQTTCIKPSNPHYMGLFGDSIALAGNTMAVGAYGESSSGSGINSGVEAETYATSESGAVYIFNRDVAGVWHQQAHIKASNTDKSDKFGSSVALSENTLSVGAVGEDSASTGVNATQLDNLSGGSGAAYVFTRDGNSVWTQQAYIKASNTGNGDGFGNAVSISNDRLVVSASGEDSAATGVNANELDNSAMNSGAVYMFVRDSNEVWSQQAYIKASNTDAIDKFGNAAELFEDILVIGASEEASSATGINGNESYNSTVRAGAVYVFE